MSLETQLLRELHQKVNVLMANRTPCWVTQKDISFLADKSADEMETFRKNNKGLWKNTGTEIRPRYVYDINSIK